MFNGFLGTQILFFCIFQSHSGEANCHWKRCLIFCSFCSVKIVWSPVSQTGHTGQVHQPTHSMRGHVCVGGVPGLGWGVFFRWRGVLKGLGCCGVAVFNWMLVRGCLLGGEPDFNFHSEHILVYSLWLNFCHAIISPANKFCNGFKKDYIFILMIVTCFTALPCDGLSDKTVHTWTVLVWWDYPSPTFYLGGNRLC